MKLRSCLIFISMAGALLMTACNKDNDESPNQAELDAISSGPWKISSVTVMGADVSPLLPSCYLDNIVTFRTNYTGTIEESANVCDPSTAGDFIWEFNANATALIVSEVLIPGGDNQFTIESLSSTSLVLSQPTTLAPSPIPITVVVSLVHP